MHGRIDQTSVIVVALDISWAVEPINSHGLYPLLGVVVDVDKFHNPAEVVRLAGRLAHEVHLICTSN